MQATVSVADLPPSSLSPVVWSPGTPTVVMFYTVGVFGGVFSAATSGLSMTTLDALVAYVLVQDAFGNGIPASRIAAAGLLLVVELGAASCSFTSSRGNLEFPQSASSPMSSEWSTLDFETNVTGSAVCAATLPGSTLLRCVLSSTNGSVIASSSVSVAVTDGGPGLAVHAVIVLPHSTAIPLALPASTAFGPLPVTSVDVRGVWGTGVAGALTAGSLVLVSFTSLGPRFEPLLSGQLASTTTFLLTFDAIIWPCVIIGVQTAPSASSDGYSMIAACTVNTTGSHNVSIVSSETPVGQSPSNTLALNVACGDPALNSAYSRVTNHSNAVAITMDLFDALGNAVLLCNATNTSCRTFLACLVPVIPLSSMTCVSMDRVYVGNTTQLVANVSSLGLATGTYHAAVLELSPPTSMVDLTTIFEIADSSTSVIPQPLAITAAAMVTSECTCHCALATLALQGITVITSAGFAADAVLWSPDQISNFATIAPLCNETWCTFSLTPEILATVAYPYFFRLRFYNDTGVAIESELSAGFYKLPSVISWAQSVVDFSAMPSSSVLSTAGTPFSILTLPAFSGVPSLRDVGDNVMCSESASFSTSSSTTTSSSSDVITTTQSHAFDGGVYGIVLTFAPSWGTILTDVWWSAYLPGAWEAWDVAGCPPLTYPPKIVSLSGDPYAAAWLTLLQLPLIDVPVTFYMYGVEPPAPAIASTDVVAHNGDTPSATVQWLTYDSAASWAAGASPNVSQPITPVAITLPADASASSTVSVSFYTNTMMSGGKPFLSTGVAIGMSVLLKTLRGDLAVVPNSSSFSGFIASPSGTRQSLRFTTSTFNHETLLLASFTPTAVGMHQVLVCHNTQGILAQDSSLAAYSLGLSPQGGFYVGGRSPDIANVTVVLIGAITGGVMVNGNKICVYAWVADAYGALFVSSATVRRAMIAMH